MLFNSLAYFIFLPLVVLFYFNLPPRHRNIFLLGASLFFYMYWQWEYIFLILFENVINFYAGKKIGTTRNDKEKKRWLIFALITNLGLLFFFKYTNFALTSFTPLAQLFNPGFRPQIIDILLPVGISFHTFTTLSYTIDVFRKKHAVENSFVKFSLYVTFFPLLLAGPIERSTNLLDQFATVKRFSSKELIEGCKLIIWGLFKKIVIADRLAIYVNQVYADPHANSGSTLLLATLFFTIQIYCDFSGYTDIAIGSARILGFKLMQNFNLPYLAHSIADFWKRWHISLSSWFGDYVYIPLGGNRVPISRWILNIYVVFLVSGLWHGANWTFVLWGGLHASYYLLEYLGTQFLKLTGYEKLMKTQSYKIAKIGMVFLMVSFAWIFFRAKSIGDAFYISRHIFDWTGQLWWGSSSVTTLLSIFLIFTLFIVQIMQYNGKLAIYFRPALVSRPVSWLAYASLLFAIALLGMSSNAFIYFQF